MKHSLHNGLNNTDKENIMAQTNRPEGLSGGGRGAGGIVGSSGKYVNPIYRQVGPSVKIKPADPRGRAAFNQSSFMKTIDAGTGAAAKKGAKATGVTGKKGVQPPIKINSK
jgi:hypothetical protein